MNIKANTHSRKAVSIAVAASILLVFFIFMDIFWACSVPVRTTRTDSCFSYLWVHTVTYGHMQIMQLCIYWKTENKGKECTHITLAAISGLEKKCWIHKTKKIPDPNVLKHYIRKKSMQDSWKECNNQKIKLHYIPVTPLGKNYSRLNISIALHMIATAGLSGPAHNRLYSKVQSYFQGL